MEPQRVSGGVQRGALFVSDAGQGRVSLRDCGALTPLAAPAAGTATAGDKEYLIKPFRLLSAVLIAGHWVDFSDPALFDGKEALFDKKTVLCDHKLKVSEWVGVTTNARRTTSQGVVGVDADLKINREQDRVIFDGSITRGLEQDPAAISSCSVTVEWRGRRSHPALDGWEFWCHLGEEVGGEVVRWIVEEIVRIHEVSLVYSGADPFARSLSASAPAPGVPPMSKIGALVRDLYGVDPESDAAAQAVRDAHKLAAESRRLTGKEQPDQVLGVLGAFHASHGRVEQLTRDLEQARGELDKVIKLNLIDEAIQGKPDGKGGRVVKLFPSQRAWAESQPLQGLQAYLDNAPPLPHSGTFKPKTEPELGGSGGQTSFTEFDRGQLAQLNAQRRAAGQAELSETDYLAEKRRRQRAREENR